MSQMVYFLGHEVLVTWTARHALIGLHDGKPVVEMGESFGNLSDQQREWNVLGVPTIILCRPSGAA